MVSNGTDRLRDHMGSSSKSEGSERQLPVMIRRSAFARIRAGLLDTTPAAILLTGEGGAGKTWLWNQITQSLPGKWRALAVDLTSTLNASDFLLLIGHALGISRTATNAALARIEINATLHEEASEGRSLVLIVEDAQTANSEVWEEIRVLANHLGEAGGFAGLLIVAQTELVRRLRERSLAFVAARITDHVHLQPLDLDECRSLVVGTFSSESEEQFNQTVEEIHRDSGGNSREIRRIAKSLVARNLAASLESPAALASPELNSSVRSRTKDRVLSKQAGCSAELSSSSSMTPVEATRPKLQKRDDLNPQTVKPSLSLLPSKPPIRLEDGLIEVGWQGEEPIVPESAEQLSFVESSQSIESADLSESASRMSFHEEKLVEHPQTDEPSEEWIEDPYAALQAWSEWAQNRQRLAEPKGELAHSDSSSIKGSLVAQSQDTELELERSSMGAPLGSSIRAEAQHEFSPYGQLFGETRRGKPA